MAATFSIYFNTLKHRAKGFEPLKRGDGNLHRMMQFNLTTVHARTHTITHTKSHCIHTHTHTQRIHTSTQL